MAQYRNKRLQKKLMKKALLGMLNGRLANVGKYRLDPYGNNPVCKNKLGTWYCELCGSDVRGKQTACEAAPRHKRWRIEFAT